MKIKLAPKKQLVVQVVLIKSNYLKNCTLYLELSLLKHGADQTDIRTQKVFSNKISIYLLEKYFALDVMLQSPQIRHPGNLLGSNFTALWQRLLIVHLIHTVFSSFPKYQIP
jgi:hypothetical protein